MRIDSSTAEAYFIKAGDYIQILDVDRWQCIDFQCFAAHKLDQGIQSPIDVSTTRTLTGHIYPMPGLHAKYYDQDMLPLIGVIQDTCGKHDSFALAYPAKYYEDIGYPGHVNYSIVLTHCWPAMVLLPEKAGWQSISFSTQGLTAVGS